LTPLCLRDVYVGVSFFTENLRVFKKIILPLFALQVVAGIVEQYLNQNMEMALSSPTGGERQIFLFGFFSILSSLSFPVLISSLGLFAVSSLSQPELNLGLFFKKHLNQIFIETLRAWGSITRWSLLLILPGLWKYIEYIFVPFVVTLSPSYEAGQVDALKKSVELVRRNIFKVVGIILVFQLFVPLIFSSLFDAYRIVWKTPLPSLGLSLVESYFVLFSIHILYIVFKNQGAQYDGSHV
jgi:hypothetical protein